MNESILTEQIKRYAFEKAKIDKIGIAPAERFNGAPEGFHPTDFLPGCRSVVVCAVRIPDGAVQAIMRVMEDKLYGVHGIYGAYGYVGGPNYTLLFAAYRLSHFIEKCTGEIATPCPSGPTHGMKMMSMRHSAVAAGLGEFGWHSCVITPEFGTRNRFCVVLTTAELEPDPLYSGPALCNPAACDVCSKLCPTGAIPSHKPRQARIVDIGGKRCAYAGLDANKCRMAGAGVFAEFNETGRDLADMSDRHPLHFEADRTSGYYTEHMNNNFFMHATSFKCGYCLAYCPSGGWKEHFYDTGLSRIDTRRYTRAGRSL
jgi:epoxyqueuosine reductase QueG